jgi:hypothetical protein
VFVLATTVKVTVPFPLPDPPDAMLIQELSSDADHAHPVGDATVNETEPPARATDCAAGETEYVHGIPDWTTLTDCPAIVSEPVRWDELEFAATVNVRVPLPAPLAPFVIEIQDEDDEADHEQAEGAVTAKVLDPPESGNERLAGVTLNVQEIPD